MLLAQQIHSIGFINDHQSCFASGEGCAPLCFEWKCTFGSAMDGCMFCTLRGLAAPNQTGSLQWQLRVTLAGMAGNDSGIGSGWQQSKQN